MSTRRETRLHAIVFEQHLDQLQNIASDLERRLREVPGMSESETIRVHKTGMICFVGCDPDGHPDHYEEHTNSGVPVLQPLIDFLATARSLQDALHNLVDDDDPGAE